MITVPTAPWLHHVFDVAAWLAAALAARWTVRHRRSTVEALAADTRPSYFLALALGAVAGAWLAGSLNSLRWADARLSHSVAGALAGAVIAVELWKWRSGITRSTGGGFVLPLAVGIAVGRLGCFFAGLPDGTYGIATTLPWGVDLGDGVPRHPVALYESVAMALFAAVYVGAIRRDRTWATKSGFHWFVLVYAVQRFAWEFLKPYPPVLGPLNVFHLLMIGLVAYALVWIRRGHAARPPALA